MLWCFSNHSVGLFGKLQQVMQGEKETDLEFLKLQTKASPNSKTLQLLIFLYLFCRKHACSWKWNCVDWQTIVLCKTKKFVLVYHCLFLVFSSYVSSDEPTCLNVKILSRYLDAKLIVCHVSPSKDTEVKFEPISSCTCTNSLEIFLWYFSHTHTLSVCKWMFWREDSNQEWDFNQDLTASVF